MQRALVLIVFCAVGPMAYSANIPTGDELFGKLENTFGTLDSYEVVYEVTLRTRLTGDTALTTLMLWRTAPGRHYIEPLCAPPRDPSGPRYAQFHMVKSVTATEERTLLLGAATSFIPREEYSYVVQVAKPEPVISLGSGGDDTLNPTTLMLPSIRILKSRGHQAALEGPTNLGNGITRTLTSPFRVQADSELVVRKGIPGLRVKVESGVWKGPETFSNPEMIMELWLDPAAGWMPRERLEYVDGKPFNDIKVTEYMQLGELWYPKDGIRTVYDLDRPEIINGTFTYSVIWFEKKSFALSDLEVDLSKAAYTIGDGTSRPVMNPGFWASKLDEVGVELKKSGNLNQP